MTRLIDSTPAVAVVLTQGAWIFIFELVSVGGGVVQRPFHFLPRRFDLSFFLDSICG
jgi:hypothetical protein